MAERRLRKEGSHKSEAIVQVGKPTKMDGNNWRCPFQISGIGMRKIGYGHGIDAMQALVQAIEGIRVRLEQSGKQFTWEEGEPGDTGFTRFVPHFYGFKFAKRLERFIEREVERFAQAAEARYNRRQKKNHKDEV